MKILDALRKPLRDSFAQVPRTLALVWRSSPRTTIVLGLLTLVAAGLPPLIAWVGKLIVDAVVAGSPEETLRLTRELLARSRATLDELMKRLATDPEVGDGAAGPTSARS